MPKLYIGNNQQGVDHHHNAFLANIYDSIGAVKVGAGGELTKSLIDGKKVLRYLKHGSVDSPGLQRGPLP